MATKQSTHVSHLVAHIGILWYIQLARCNQTVNTCVTNSGTYWCSFLVLTGAWSPKLVRGNQTVDTWGTYWCCWHLVQLARGLQNFGIQYHWCVVTKQSTVNSRKRNWERTHLKEWKDIRFWTAVNDKKFWMRNKEEKALKSKPDKKLKTLVVDVMMFDW